MRGILAVLAVAILVSGCTETEPMQEADSQVGPRLLIAPVANENGVVPMPEVPGRDDWFRLPVFATQEGAFAAYALEVPEGASVKAWYGDESFPVVEYAFLEEAGLDAWGLVFVDLDDGRVLTVVSGVPTDSVGFGAGASMGVQRNLGTGQYPGYADLQGLADGARLGVVVAAKGSASADVGIRFLPRTPVQDSGFDWPSEDVDEFRSRTSGVAWLPEKTGEGNGFELDLFYDYESLTSAYGDRIVAGNTRVTELVPDSIGQQPANDLDVSVGGGEGAEGDGFTALLAWSWTQVHAGTLIAHLDARDAEPVAATTPLVPHPIVSSFVAMAIGDGEGPSQGHMRLTYAGASTGFPKLTILDHFALGASLESLFGIPVEDASASFGSVVPAPVIDGGRLVHEGPTQRVIVGLPQYPQ